jgi:hypothetical protein
MVKRPRKKSLPPNEVVPVEVTLTVPIEAYEPVAFGESKIEEVVKFPAPAMVRVRLVALLLLMVMPLDPTTIELPAMVL